MIPPSSDPSSRALDQLIARELNYRVERLDGQWLLLSPGGGGYVLAATEDEAWGYVPTFSSDNLISLTLIFEMMALDGSDTIDIRFTAREKYYRYQVHIGDIHLNVSAETVEQARSKLFLDYLHNTRDNRL